MDLHDAYSFDVNLHDAHSLDVEIDLLRNHKAGKERHERQPEFLVMFFFLYLLIEQRNDKKRDSFIEDATRDIKEAHARVYRMTTPTQSKTFSFFHEHIHWPKLSLTFHRRDVGALRT